MVYSWERARDNCDVIAIWDINLDSMQWNTLDGYEGEMIEDMNNRVVMLGFIQEIEGVTHTTGGRGTTIDHIWSNCPRRTVEVGIKESSDSDHDIIWGSFHNINLELKPERSERRFGREYMKERFLEACSLNFVEQNIAPP